MLHENEQPEERHYQPPPQHRPTRIVIPNEDRSENKGNSNDLVHLSKVGNIDFYDITEKYNEENNLPQNSPLNVKYTTVI